MAKRAPSILRRSSSSRRDDEPRNIYGKWGHFLRVGPDAAPIRMTEETGLGLAAYWACANALASDLAVNRTSIWRLTETPSGEDRVEAKELRAHRLLTVSPDGGRRSPVTWKQTLFGHAARYGDGYAEIERTTMGEPIALHLIDPRDVEPVETKEKLVYRLSNGEELPCHDVIHLAGFSHNGLEGYNPTRLGNGSNELAFNQEKWANQFYRNGARPSGIIEMPGILTEPVANRMAEGFRSQNEGLSNAHKVAVIEGGGKWVKTSASALDSQHIEQRRFQLQEICRRFRVPPHKVAELSDAHLANVEAANLDYLLYCLLFWLVALEQQINLKLLHDRDLNPIRGGNFVCEHVIDMALRADLDSQINYYRFMRGIGAMSSNEIRRKQGMRPIPAEQGGDLYLVQGAQIKLEDAGKNFVPTGTAGESKPDEGDDKPKTKKDKTQ